MQIKSQMAEETQKLQSHFLQFKGLWNEIVI